MKFRMGKLLLTFRQRSVSGFGCGFWIFESETGLYTGAELVMLCSTGVNKTLTLFLFAFNEIFP